MKRIVLLSFSLILVVLPSVAQAKLDLYNPKKHYGDEGKAIADPTSRCTGASFVNAHKASLAQEKKEIDAAFAKAPENAAVQNAADAYDKALQVGWEAMLQPYCGFGAFGTTAAFKSYNKTNTDARAKFLAALKGATGVTMALTNTPAPTTPKEPAVIAAPAVLNLSGVALGKESENVKAFQQLLVKAGVLSSAYTTGYFGTITKDALIAFQIKKGIILSKTSAGAGMIGPKTQAALKSMK